MQKVWADGMSLVRDLKTYRKNSLPCDEVNPKISHRASLKKVAIVYNDDMDVQGNDILSSQGVIDTAEKVEQALKSGDIATRLIPLRDDVEIFVQEIKKTDDDIIFNLCECAMGNSLFEMNVAAILEIFGFRFTGSGSLTLGICLNKARAKEILTYHGIPTARFFVCNSLAHIPHPASLSFPLMVKPVHEDASVGIDKDAVVGDRKSLHERVAYVLGEYKQPALVEEYIDGREFNVAIMGNGKPRALPVSEIDFSQLSENDPKVCTFDAKWIIDSSVYLKTPPVCPANISEELKQQLFTIALKAYAVLGCRDYARVDIRMGEDGIPKILEVNPNPDISPEAGFARSARAGGFDYSRLIFEIVTMAYTRYKTQNAQ